MVDFRSYIMLTKEEYLIYLDVKIFSNIDFFKSHCKTVANLITYIHFINYY